MCLQLDERPHSPTYLCKPPFRFPTQVAIRCDRRQPPSIARAHDPSGVHECDNGLSSGGERIEPTFLRLKQRERTGIFHDHACAGAELLDEVAGVGFHEATKGLSARPKSTGSFAAGQGSIRLAGRTEHWCSRESRPERRRLPRSATLTGLWVVEAALGPASAGDPP